MQLFNIASQGEIKSTAYINANCGGRYTRKEAYNIGGIGMGGLRYVSGIDAIDALDTQERFRANIELLKEGLGIYVRSLKYNYLLAIAASEILQITLIKEEDVLHNAEFSFTHKLLGWGMSYHYARIMLLDNEIDTLHDTFFSVVTEGGTFKFSYKRHNPHKLDALLSQSIFTDRYVSKIQGYRIE